MKAKAILYWVTTGFLAFNVLSGGVAELLRLPGNVEGMIFLGYPVYFMIILGVWKVLATIALLVPSFPRLKEWAYAGIFFNMTGAAVSHVVSGGCSVAHVVYRFPGCLNDRFVGTSPPKPYTWSLFPASSSAWVPSRAV